MSRFEFVIVFLVLPRLPLRGSWRGAPERARPLMWNRRHSDSLALTKALLIAARCLCITGLALSVCCADTSPKGRGFLLTVKPSFVQPLRHGFAVPPPLVGEALAFRSALPLRQRLPYQGQQRRPPPVAETGRRSSGRGQQDARPAPRAEADAGSRNPERRRGKALLCTTSQSHFVRQGRVAAPSIRRASLASCWPLPQQLLPVSATGGGRRCCPW